MSTEKFNRLFDQAASEAAHDLPIILAQFEQGQNPEHAKVLRSIEQLLAIDPDMDSVAREMLISRAEAMRPKLAWDQATIVRMVAVVLNAPTVDQEAARSVQDKILKGRNPSGGGRGRKPGSTVQKVEGAAEKIELVSLIDSSYHEVVKSQSVSSPVNIANKVKKHLAENGYNFPTSSLAELINAVIMGENDTATVAAPDGAGLFTFNRI